ncbi:hypothetical protein GCM10022251_17450 [Phytohabitans flavus]|uniref:Uncharacterized protein n=1 Tax=Phytohabitans flavus TaxID=1076124 RepID=A0A6F8Y5V0_9ACTN|nr:hypothetical protein Pflav_079020 [Phytohabitans flavus]
MRKRLTPVIGNKQAIGRSLATGVRLATERVTGVRYYTPVAQVAGSRPPEQWATAAMISASGALDAGGSRHDPEPDRADREHRAAGGEQHQSFCDGCVTPRVGGR